MKKCLLVFYDNSLAENFALVKGLIDNGSIEVVGVSSFFEPHVKLYKTYLGFPVFPVHDIRFLSIDIAIIFSYDGNYLNLFESQLLDFGFFSYQIVRWNVLSRFGFDLTKYQLIKKNIPTIFSPNCWGGITYNSLGLEFRSPLINLFLSPADFLKFCSNFKKYIDEPLVLVSYKFEPNLKHDYPICMCGDIGLNFNHYLTFDDAVEAWNRRKIRINDSNIFVMFFCEDEQFLDDFVSLKYNKICFVNFKCEHANASSRIFYINQKSNSVLSKQSFPDLVLNMARGNLMYYNVFDLFISNANPCIPCFNDLNYC